ncbi:UNKNOWN [Stylonychia lemnae]|uniref:Uncharacterized protein n=1 Tax=Stylonychia lemnae TaxID=5949 RepID=A0A078B3V0_STYLE|nr:UNKNOWN [Stylonychia lemnae]|eukprot:CDW88193.1 UNKNOWN [Stylonychia lemnae]
MKSNYKQGKLNQTFNQDLDNDFLRQSDHMRANSSLKNNQNDQALSSIKSPQHSKLHSIDHANPTFQTNQKQETKTMGQQKYQSVFNFKQSHTINQDELKKELNLLQNDDENHREMYQTQKILKGYKESDQISRLHKHKEEYYSLQNNKDDLPDNNIGAKGSNYINSESFGNLNQSQKSREQILKSKISINTQQRSEQLQQVSRNAVKAKVRESSKSFLIQNFQDQPDILTSLAEKKYGFGEIQQDNLPQQQQKLQQYDVRSSSNQLNIQQIMNVTLLDRFQGLLNMRKINKSNDGRNIGGNQKAYDKQRPKTMMRKRIVHQSRLSAYKQDLTPSKDRVIRINKNSTSPKRNSQQGTIHALYNTHENFFTEPKIKQQRLPSLQQRIMNENHKRNSTSVQTNLDSSRQQVQKVKLLIKQNEKSINLGTLQGNIQRESRNFLPKKKVQNKTMMNFYRANLDEELLKSTVNSNSPITSNIQRPMTRIMNGSFGRQRQSIRPNVNEQINVVKMRNLLESMDQQVQNLRYQEYLAQVEDLNKIKSYFANNYLRMTEETRKVMIDHIMSRQKELESITLYEVA